MSFGIQQFVAEESRKLDERRKKRLEPPPFLSYVAKKIPLLTDREKKEHEIDKAYLWGLVKDMQQLFYEVNLVLHKKRNIADAYRFEEGVFFPQGEETVLQQGYIREKCSAAITFQITLQNKNPFIVDCILVFVNPLPDTPVSLNEYRELSRFLVYRCSNKFTKDTQEIVAALKAYIQHYFATL